MNKVNSKFMPYTWFSFHAILSCVWTCSCEPSKN